MLLVSVFLAEGQIGQHIVFGVIHRRGELGHLGPDLVGYGTPLGARGFCRMPREGGGDEGRDNPPPALAGMDEGIVLKVDAAPLLGSAKYLGHRGPYALMGISDDQLDPAQPASRQLA
jgi:hypothetical protein